MSGDPDTALFVEGGGLRGAFSAGVLAELARPGGPRLADIVAVSSAAPTAAYLVAGQVEDGIRVWENHTHGSQLLSPLNWLRGARLMDIDGLVDVFARTILLHTYRLADAGTRLFVSVANCHSGEAEYVRATPENTLDLLKATMAIPLAYGKVVPVNGTPYVDGGVVHPVPIEHTLSLGLPRTIAILTQPRGYRRRRNDLVARFLGLTYARYPALGRALLSRADVANAALARIDRLEGEGALSVIRPLRPLPAGRLSRSRTDILASVEIGREAGRAWRASMGAP